MRILKQALAVFGAFVVLAVIVAFVAPRKTHALVAALVQIVPGTTTHVGQNESQLVSLICDASPHFSAVSLTGTFDPSVGYVVPAGYTLIVTDYEWFVSGGSAGLLTSDTFINTADSGGFVYSFAIADGNGNSFVHEHYATGIRIGSGVGLGDSAAASFGSVARLQGYLVPND